MLKPFRQTLSVLLAWLLILQGAWSLAAQSSQVTTAPQDNRPAPSLALEYSAPPALDEVVKLSSLEIAALAEKFAFDQHAIRIKTDAINKQSKAREEAFKIEAKAADKQIEAKERELKKLKSTVQDPEINKERKRIQCDILKIKKDVTDKSFDFLQQQIASDVQIAKLTLLANWRSVNHELEQKIASGVISQRPFGNVLDIGNRGTKKPFKDQEKDVQWGQGEIDAARQRKTFPQEINDPVITEYVNRMASNIARNSDLQVPLKVFVAQQELRKGGRPVGDKSGQPQQVANAMALPGGFLIVYAGLILESENESQLAGVIAHEMAHSAARHSNRLANKGKIFSIAQLATMIGLQIFAPGLFSAASYLSYYLKGLLLQAIFNGLGIVFTLDALGVSRDFELEADQLGMQYAWKTGYDPEGFIKLFDQMSQKEGYASHTSFFATHPAFGDRILNALEEYRALHSIVPDRQFLTDTSEFQEIKARLSASLRRPRKEEKDSGREKPSLKPDELSPEDCPEVLSPAPGPPSPNATAKERTQPQSTPTPGTSNPKEDQPPVIKRQKLSPRSLSRPVPEQSSNACRLPDDEP